MSAAAAAPFQFEDWMLPPVKDLVQVVGRFEFSCVSRGVMRHLLGCLCRAFYSDEHVVVLDMLTQYRMLRVRIVAICSLFWIIRVIFINQYQLYHMVAVLGVII